jgi:hypothetical protein
MHAKSCSQSTGDDNGSVFGRREEFRQHSSPFGQSVVMIAKLYGPRVVTSFLFFQGEVLRE